MTEDIASTKRIDELFDKGQTEGLSEREKAEFLFLIEAQGLRLIEIKSEDVKNVH